MYRRDKTQIYVLVIVSVRDSVTAHWNLYIAVCCCCSCILPKLFVIPLFRWNRQIRLREHFILWVKFFKYWATGIWLQRFGFLTTLTSLNIRSYQNGKMQIYALRSSEVLRGCVSSKAVMNYYCVQFVKPVILLWSKRIQSLGVFLVRILKLKFWRIWNKRIAWRK